MTSLIKFRVDAGIGRIRLEEYLFGRFHNLSRMYIREIIKNEKCEVNGVVENKGKRIRTDDFIEIEIDLDRETAMLPEFISLDIVFEDADLLIVNKPAGILVHPTHREKSGTLLNGLSFYLNSGSGDKSIRPGLVHRLDKETSGLLVVAKNLRSHRHLARQFQRKLVKKRYAALVDGRIAIETGAIEAPIGRFPEKKLWGVKAGAKPSITNYQVIERNSDSTLIELEPITGRTNQLRIHCASIGHPIIGDVGRGGRPFDRLCLHAGYLKFDHPAIRRSMEFFAAMPNEFSSAGTSRQILTTPDGSSK